MGAALERQRVEIPYSPRQQFLGFHYRKQRWACMVAHRRAGKTVACINELIKAALCAELRDARYAYVAPYYSQAKDIAWTYLKRFSAPVPGHSVNESELRIDYPNGARVRLYGADNYDRLRGGYLDGVVLDEYADMSPAAWGEVIRPMLADRKGWACFIGTPKGRNAFWQIWEAAQKDQTFYGLMLKASETGLVDPEELEAARRDMTPEQYEQEFECSFDAAILGAYYGREIAEAERDGRIIELPGTEMVVHTAWDLGMDDPTAIWFFQVAPDGLRIVDYYENAGHGLEHYVDELKRRGYTYGDHWLPHDARVQEMVSGRTRVEFLQSRGLRCRLVPGHEVMDGINAARVSFARMWFDGHKCRQGIEALRQYHAEFDDKLRTFKPRPRHDWTSHAADAFRYLAMAWKEMKPSDVSKPKPKDLEYHVDSSGKLVSNMTVKDFVDMQRRKRLANG
jgi:hypothetical protein